MTQRTVRLDEACLVITDGTHYTPKAQETGRPFLTVKDMLDDRLDFKTCSQISEADFQNAARNGCCPQTGDILFSKDGTVGKVRPYTSEEDCAVLSSIAILRPRHEVLEQGYFAHYLRSDSFLKKALRNKTDSAIRRIILANLRNLEIPLPPLEEQRRIAAILDKGHAIHSLIDRREKVFLAVEESLFAAPSVKKEGQQSPQGYLISLRFSGSKKVQASAIGNLLLKEKNFGPSHLKQLQITLPEPGAQCPVSTT